MTKISVSELKANTGKYVAMAQEGDVFITKNGKLIAKLVTAKANKLEAYNRLRELFADVQFSDTALEEAREERLR